eukprot:1701267-Pleurochrysis_carterae.AAC.1
MQALRCGRGSLRARLKESHVVHRVGQREGELADFEVVREQQQSECGRPRHGHALRAVVGGAGGRVGSGVPAGRRRKVRAVLALANALGILLEETLHEHVFNLEDGRKQLAARQVRLGVGAADRGRRRSLRHAVRCGVVR